MKLFADNASARILSALAVVLLSGLVYVNTAVFSAGFHDSAELALRAMQLGATHAPGAPLHTVLGHLGTLILGDPALATAWLSLLAASLGAGMLAWLIASLTPGLWLAVAGGMSYALLLPIWTNAVEIELYSLSALCILTAIVSARIWLQAGATGFPVWLALSCGVALAAHFAAILLMPVFFALLLYACGWRDWRPWSFCVVIAMAIGLVALGNMLLAANVPPFGEYVPLSLAGLIGYMSGSEHAPLSASGANRMLRRLIEHAGLFSRNLLYAGAILSFYGAYTAWCRDNVFTGFMAGLFLVYFGYFTLFGSGDYFMMVAPAYAVAAVWLALGAHAVGQMAAKGRHAELTGVGLLVAMAAVLLLTQFESRRHDARSNQAAAYVEESFRTLPANAVVVARWNEFTLLRYYQYRWQQREDLRLLVPARRIRHYHYGDVADYLQFVSENICQRPVVTNRITDELASAYDLQDLPDSRYWKVLTPKATNQCTGGA